MTVLVTGGAGYIGSHFVNLLRETGREVVVVDDMVSGFEERIAGIPFVRMDLAERDSSRHLQEVIGQHSVDSVVHFAARKQVLESTERPVWYYQQNIGGLAGLLDAMVATHVDTLVFSSSAAVYGDSRGAAIAEDSATVPINPYGETKLAGEWLVRDTADAAGIRAANLRYFNVAGAGPPVLGDRVAANLVPMVFERLDRGEAPHIFGDDYDTPDGTCVRDYVHVVDLVEAHLAILDYLGGEPAGAVTFNVGTGVGSSVREVVAAILEISGSSVVPEVEPRRAGDPAAVVAAVDKIDQAVGWRARLGLADIVASAWGAHRFLSRRPGTAV